MFDDWKQIECPREFSPEFYENHEEHVNNSRTLRDVQILSLPDMFLRWDRGGPRPWPEDCCRIGYIRIPCDFIRITMKIIGKRWELQKVISFWCVPSCFTCSSNVFFYYGFHCRFQLPRFPRSWLESSWTVAVWLHLLRCSWDLPGELRILKENKNIIIL